METLEKTNFQRFRIHVTGIVQGVGFRPFVFREAKKRNLTGMVRNDTRGVIIEVEGLPEKIADFIETLKTKPPVLARIHKLSLELLEPRGCEDFEILTSTETALRDVPITPDTATCEDCLRELFDPTDRRFHYPFINCTNCGPRFTIVEDVPYDRQNTTMKTFPMCSECTREYENPLDRRFHAQPNACPECGPNLYLIDNRGEQIATKQEALSLTVSKLAAGDILAIKGLGGYHLACDALNEDSVKRLRAQKYREAKPFALMVPDLNTAKILCEISDQEAKLLKMHQSPIVLLKKRFPSPVASEVAPNYQTLGIMLPYTPLHHLLLQKYHEILPKDRPAVLVMTSGNLSEEPIAFRDDDARTRLLPICDGILAHNREIRTRCDDSVVRVTVDGMQFVRRSRGYVPEPLKPAFHFPVPLLACGGHLKNTFCLARDDRAYVSHHIGDLENLETLTAFEEGIEHFKRLFDIEPEAIVYDLHPEYLATKYAQEYAVSEKIGVQHHHAHIASVLAEHGLDEPVIGISADGTGYGTDGAFWGCEIMIADLSSFKRVAHLEYMPLPGGEQAIRQPWRMAAVYLRKTFGDNFLNLDIPFVKNLNQEKWRLLDQMISKGINCPNTSSLGRLFDAVSALLGIRKEVGYEGQAAIELEMLAVKSEAAYPYDIHEGEPALLDVKEMIAAIVDDILNGVDRAYIAGRFHNTVAAMLTEICLRLKKKTQIKTVAMSGGVFQNQLLLEQLLRRLKFAGFRTYLNHKVPPNDGGLSFGQAAVAAAQLGIK